MEPYDPTLEALITHALTLLSPEADVTVGYVDQLRQLDVVLAHGLRQSLPHVEGQLIEAIKKPPPPPPDQLSPEQQAALRETLSRLDPKAGDAELGMVAVAHRVQASVEQESAEWDAGIYQPRGLSDATHLPLEGLRWWTEA